MPNERANLGQLRNVITQDSQAAAIIPPVATFEGTTNSIQDGGLMIFKNLQPGLFGCASKMAKVLYDLAAYECFELPPFEFHIYRHAVKEADGGWPSHNIGSLSAEPYARTAIVRCAVDELHARIFKRAPQAR